MSTAAETQPKRERIACCTSSPSSSLVVLAVITVVMFRSARQEGRPQEKADELIQALEDAGVDVQRTPEQIAGVLGDDGGAVCANPNDALEPRGPARRSRTAPAAPAAGRSSPRTRSCRASCSSSRCTAPTSVEEFQQFVDSLELTDTGN